MAKPTVSALTLFSSLNWMENAIPSHLVETNELHYVDP
jgi:hypothetical protein